LRLAKRQQGGDRRTGRMLLVAAAVCGMLLLALTGCVKGEAGIDVHANGSADVSIAVTLPEEASSLAGGTFDSLAEQLGKQGFEAAVTQEEGEGLSFRASRRYTREDFANSAYENGFTFDVTGLRLTYKRQSKWLYDVHRLSGAFEPGELLSGDSRLLERYRALPSLVRRLAENRVSLDFKLSLPVPVVSHNASAQDGRTLVWKLAPTKDTPVEVTIAAPNIRTFIAAGAVILLFIAGTAWLIAARRRRRKKQKSQ